jgi:hypothetical protein
MQAENVTLHRDVVRYPTLLQDAKRFEPRAYIIDRVEQVLVQRAPMYGYILYQINGTLKHKTEIVSKDERAIQPFACIIHH